MSEMADLELFEKLEKDCRFAMKLIVEQHQSVHCTVSADECEYAKAWLRDNP
jgi:hypothetical protein